MKNKNFSIVITGEWPGAGQSTTAKLLSQELNFNRVYAGFLFRKFAHVWNIEKKNLTWSEFEEQMKTGTLDLDDYPFTESDFNEFIVQQWQKTLKNHANSELWDRLVDEQSLKALGKSGNVVEAKLGVLLDKTNILNDFSPQSPILKFLLTCPPEISAHRIIKRKIENKELPEMKVDNEEYKDLVRSTTNDLIERQLGDWERYEKFYGVLRSDIYHDEIIQIDTSHKESSGVVSAILEEIENKQ